MGAIVSGQGNYVAVGGGPQIRMLTSVALADSDATLGASDLLKGMFTCATASTGRTLTWDTAANIIAALTAAYGTPATGAWFDVNIGNKGANTLTTATATGLTLYGLVTVATNTCGTFRFIVTSSTTINVFRI